MLLIAQSKNYFNNPNVILQGFLYTLYNVTFNYGSILNNFLNKSVSWIELPYLFTYDFKMHLLLNDDRTNIYKMCYIKALFVSEDNISEVIEVPFLIIKDLKKVGVNKEPVIENIDNWIVYDMSTFDIKCKMKYYKYSLNSSGNNNNSLIIDRHFHRTGNANESYKIRNITSEPNMLNFEQGFKSICSRGQKSYARIRVDDRLKK